MIKFDGKINVATARSRYDKNLKVQQLLWSKMLNRLSFTKYTEESINEHKSLPKKMQDDIKDVGGFVGGTLLDGRRGGSNVISRQLVTLDVDYFKGEAREFIELLEDVFGFAYCIYSTHKHEQNKPRFRVVVPLKRPVTPDEYGAVSRRVASYIGIDYLDDTTYDPSRLMYWPSTSCDGEFVFKYYDNQWLDPEEVLATYEDWTRVESWPTSSRTNSKIKKLGKQQGDPREKDGIIGAFCRTYSMEEAIVTFLSDVYVPVISGERYTYAKGSSAGGLVVYQQCFAYSHHGTDPASGRICNSFDLVRIHMFGELDDDYNNNSKSFEAMINFARNDEKVRITIGEEQLTVAKREFDEHVGQNLSGDSGNKQGNRETVNIKEADNTWLATLDADNTGRYRATITNILIILENDPFLKENIGYNEFSHMTMIRGDLPWHEVVNHIEGDIWTDSDDACLRYYVEKIYGITSPAKVSDALAIVEKRNRFHPIREYLSAVKWDGVNRIETLLVDYLGARDCEYVRAVTRKMLVAAVARVASPGVKFDHMLVLVGQQGLGKSHIINLLGNGWYSDSLNTVQGREAYEQLQDAWLIEMAELSAMRKADVEAIKHFISKREDIYRVAYGKRVNKFPRQCVFFGTTNNTEFLKDRTGNRRFFPVVVGMEKPNKNLWQHFTKDEVHQVWAEAMELYNNGETLYLDEEMEKKALIKQEEHTEISSKEGLIREYLDILLPDNWYDLDVASRKRYIHDNDFNDFKEFDEGKVSRKRVCAMEIWCELLLGDPKQMTAMHSREINEILRNIEGWQPYAKSNGKLRFGKHYGLQRAFIRV